MIGQRLTNFLAKKKCTLLGIGPMSVNCIDAAIELSNENNIPLMLIPSRRQVDSAEMGGGYVNNWTTEEFSRYVLGSDKKGQVIMARDHGGPWQNTIEKDSALSLPMAMNSAKNSYKVDIESGIQIIHIDPSVDIHGNPSQDEILERVYELYEFCWGVAQRNGREILFEIGTEEQSGGTNTKEELEHNLNSIWKFCNLNKLPLPTFMVIQTGTRVMEMKNVGTFDSPIRVQNELPAEIQVPRMIEVCNKFNILMKQHNTDYLSDEALYWHPRLGIHAANVAPEFGVVESRAFVELLKKNGLHKLLDNFLEISLASKKWEKWMLPNTSASDFDRALIAGHYIFATQEFLEIKKIAAQELIKSDLVLEDYLKREVKSSIYRYLKNFRMV